MTAQSIAPVLNLRVTTANGDVADYRTAPVDSWRAEKITGAAISDALQTFTGLAALAYSCAVRAGHAYRTRRASTDDVQGFAQWLEQVVDVEMIVDEDDADPTPPPAKEVSSDN